jgi:hypothetical protein
VGHQAPHLRHQAPDRHEQRRATGVCVCGDQDIARFQAGLRNVADDAGPSSTVPADTARPTSAPAGTSARRYDPAMTSPSEVSTRGGVSA